MIYPSIDQLLSRVDSKYTLVITAAKRGRQIRDGSKPVVACGSRKEVTIALHEIADGVIEYERIRDGIK
ncbi:MAG: DNA-directed RNA polymerase subunit omega [Bacillota bacterium]